jgi:hypothetical protein
MASGSLANAANRAAYLTERDLTPDRLALSDYYTGEAVGAGLGAELRGVVRGAGQDGGGADALSDRLAATAGKDAEKGHGARLRPDMHPLIAETLAVVPGGSVSDRELTLLLAGRRADGGEIPAAKKREISGYDLTFSADKSVALAWAFAPTEAERAMIQQAHRDAVDEAARYVAAEIGKARKGKDGQEGAEPGHATWVSFDHFTARPTLELAVTDPETGKPTTELHTLKDGIPGDPLLHTHLFMFNVVATESGRVGSLDTMALNGRVHEFGAYYHAVLATNLKRLGVRVVRDKETGAARILSIPKRIRDAFSKRTKDAHHTAREWAATRGVDWDALSDQGRADIIKTAAKVSRQGKRDDLEQMDAWLAQAAALGWRHRSVIDQGPRLEPLPEQERRRVSYEVSQPLVSDAFEKRSVISGSDLRAMAASAHIETGITSPDDISRTTLEFRERGVEQHGRNTAILWGEDRGDRGYVKVTTQLHADQEQALIRLAQAAVADRSGDLEKGAIAAAVQRSGLDFSGAHGQTQREAIDKLGTNGRLAVLIGSAGAGKSALLGPLVDAWKAEGRKVLGIAQAWRQAQALQDAGIGKGETFALAKFMHPAVTPGLGLDRNSVVVLDELGQIGAKPMLDLLELREKHGFSIVAVGDHKQCSGIDAGPTIELLRKALGEEHVPEILTTIRQTTERERETATMFREGRAGDALERKRDDGTLEVVAGGHREAVARVAALWAERMAANKGAEDYSLTVSAPTNADAHAVSLAIREKRRDAGELGRTLRAIDATDHQGTTRHRLELAAGDRARLFDRVWGRDVDTGRPVHAGNNGSVVTVLDADRHGMVVRTADGRNARVSWAQLSKHGNGRVRLAYGDALTIDSAQGITSTEHIAAMPSGSQAVTGFKAYVAASRHRVSTFIVASDGLERREIVLRRPLGDQRPITEADVLANMARNLSRQPEKASALAFLERAVEVKRAAARGLQRGARRMEARAARAKPPTAYRQRLQRRRDERAVEAAARQIEINLDRLAKARPVQQRPVSTFSPQVRMEAVGEALVRVYARSLGAGGGDFSEATGQIVAAMQREYDKGLPEAAHLRAIVRPENHPALDAERIEQIERWVENRLESAAFAYMEKGEAGLKELAAEARRSVPVEPAVPEGPRISLAVPAAPVRSRMRA